MLLIDFFRNKSKMHIFHSEFKLLNKDNEKSACIMYRSKYLVYIIIVLEGKKNIGQAQIILKLAMWGYFIQAHSL